MKRINLALRLSLVLAIAVLAATASASSSDFKDRFQINISPNSADLLTVCKDRFVITLDLGLQSLTFIDTWNWAVCGSLSLGSTAEIKHMAINPNQTTLYLASDNGNIRKIDLTALPDTPFNGPLPTLSLEPATTFFSSDNLIDISVISPTGSSTVDCLFVQIQRESSEELSWAIFRGDTVLLTAPTPLLTADTIIEASASANLLLAKYFSTPLAETILYGYRCQPYELEPIYIAPLTLDNGGDHFRGIAINQSSDKFVIGNIGNPAGSLARFELYSLDELLWNTWLDQFDVSTTKTIMPLMLKNFSSESEPVLFFAQGDTINVLELESDTAFGAVGSSIGFSGPPRNLAESSSADGFVYASLVNSSTVNVITPNPFVKSLSTSGAITTDNFTLTINYDNSGPRPPLTYIVAECPVFSISPDGCSRIIVNNQALVGAGGTENVVLSSQDVGECSHILGVFVQDGNTPAKHQGRNAIEVSVDIPPLAQDFDLGFWDQTIIFEFTAQDLCDLASFEIHYGDSPTSPPSGGAPGTPPSPIIINNADPGKDYRIEVKGLANGTVYYGQIITKDKAAPANSSASEIKQTMPQPVKKYSDMVHEKGGFSCAISPGMSDPSARASDLALLLCPLVMLLGLFARRTFLRLFSTWGQAFRGQTPPNQNQVKE